MAKNFFPPRPPDAPKIYAYTDSQYPGLLKIGYTTRDVKDRVAQQYPTRRPGALPYKIVLTESAMRSDGSSFSDRAIHRHLKGRGIENPKKGEWFRCSVDDVRAAIIAVRERQENAENRSRDFAMRPEQAEAVEKTLSYFRSFKRENPRKPPHFLWNAKMRFGKTFATYQLAKRMKARRILVLTFKPAVQSAWEEDVETHKDFSGWRFVSRATVDSDIDTIDKNRPLVCFGSFQDYLGRNSYGGVKAKNEWVHAVNWDLVIFDEYHFGAWRENAKDLFKAEDAREESASIGDDTDFFNQNLAEGGENFLGNYILYSTRRDR
jgi:hypothetical protein